MKRVCMGRTVEAFDIVIHGADRAGSDVGHTTASYGKVHQKSEYVGQVALGYDSVRGPRRTAGVDHEIEQDELQVSDIVTGDGKLVDSSHGYGIADLYWIRVVNHMCSRDVPLMVLYGPNLDRDLAPTDMFERAAELNFIQYDQSDFSEKVVDDEVRLFEFASTSVTGLRLVGMKVKGRVLNYVWRQTCFEPSGDYYLCLCRTVPASWALRKVGLALIGGYYSGELLSPKILQQWSSLDYPIRSLIPLSMTASLLRLLEKVKGGVA